MDSIDQRLATYHEQGYVIIEGVLEDSEIQTTLAVLQPYLDLGMSGRNDFEGERTQRVYSLVGRGRVFEKSAEHPIVLEMVDRLLRPGYLLTASQAICIARAKPRSPGIPTIPSIHCRAHAQRSVCRQSGRWTTSRENTQGWIRQFPGLG
jgi:hypothetical protein